MADSEGTDSHANLLVKHLVEDGTIHTKMAYRALLDVTEDSEWGRSDAVYERYCELADDHAPFTLDEGRIAAVFSGHDGTLIDLRDDEDARRYRLRADRATVRAHVPRGD